MVYRVLPRFPPRDPSTEKDNMNTKMILLSGAISMVGVAGSVGADTYDLLQDDASAVVPLETDANGNAKECSLYLRIGASVNFLMDVKREDKCGENRFGDVVCLTNVDMKFDPGLEFNIALGIPLAERWSIELMTGISMNRLKKSTADASSTRGVVTETAVSIFNDGTLYQVPIVANLRYEFDLTETLGLGLYAGGGMQYSYNEFSDGVFVFADPNRPPVSQSDGSYYSWTLRYQFGIDLSWNIATNTTLGLRVGYSGTGDRDYAHSDQDGEPYRNATLGATFSCTF